MNESKTVELTSQVVVAVVISVCLGSVVYLVPNYVQQYGDLIVGNITWKGASKGQDYSLLVTLLLTFLVTCLGHKLLFLKLKSLASIETIDGLHRLIIYSCTPVMILVAGYLTTGNTSLNPIFLSSSLLAYIALSLLAAIFLHSGHSLGSEFLQSLYTGIWCSIFAVFGYASLALVFPWLFVFDMQPVLFMALSLVAICSALFVFSRRSERASRFERALLSIVQLPLPLLAVVLLPTVYVIEGEGAVAGIASPVLYGFTGLVVVVSYLEQLYRYRKYSNSQVLASHGIALSSLILIALAYHIGATASPIVSADDYHFGEFLSPWVSLWDFGLLPFWDITPARGLVNYVPGMVNAVMFDGAAASIPSTHPIIFLAYSSLLFLLLSQIMRKEIAFFIVIIFPYVNGISEIQLVVGAFLCGIVLAARALDAQVWCLVCLAMGTAAVLFAPGQSALVILALIPLSLYVIYVGIRNGERIRGSTIVLFLGFCALVAFTPLWKMVFGAIQYGLEQSSLNSVAHGINWSSSFGFYWSNPWLAEVVRTSWIIVGILAAFELVKQVQRKGANMISVFLPVTIFLISLLFVFRSAGRIDPALATRLGLMSMWSVTLLLPVLFFAFRTTAPGIPALFCWLFLVGITGPHFHRPDYFNFTAPIIQKTPIRSVTSETHAAMEAARQAIPRYGYALPNQAHIQRLWETKAFLDIILDPDETYLDMTNRGAQYFYFSRRQPIESAAIYNLVSAESQLRAVESLQDAPPPAILLASQNLNHDGGGAALRSHILYRHILGKTNYLLLVAGNQLWFVAPDRVARVRGNPGVRVIDNPVEQLEIFDAVLTSKDLKNIPVSWGRSLTTLGKEVSLVGKLLDEDIVVRNDVTQVARDSYEVTGPDPFIRFNAQDMQLSGQSAGLLSFEFECLQPSGNRSALEVFWRTETVGEGALNSTRFQSDAGGSVLVPLDAYPGWILSESIKSIRIDVGRGETTCTRFRLENIELLQRNVISQI